MDRKAMISRAITAGFAATAVMTALMYLAPFFGLPKMDVAAMLGNFFTSQPAEPYNGAWNLGMLIHFINGTVIFSVVYLFTLYSAMPGRQVLSGTLFGVTLWLLSQIFVMPLLGAGFFATSTPTPILSVLGSLLAHIVYGAVLGKVIGEPIVKIAFDRPTVRDLEEEHVF